MKISVTDFALLDLDAPVLPAYKRGKRLVVWCKYCCVWHSHGRGEGHREAHCAEETPYSQTGYNLAVAGRWDNTMEQGPAQ